MTTVTLCGVDGVTPVELSSKVYEAVVVGVMVPLVVLTTTLLGDFVVSVREVVTSGTKVTKTFVPAGTKVLVTLVPLVTTSRTLTTKSPRRVVVRTTRGTMTPTTTAS